MTDPMTLPHRIEAAEEADRYKRGGLFCMNCGRAKWRHYGRDRALPYCDPIPALRAKEISDGE